MYKKIITMLLVIAVSSFTLSAQKTTPHTYKNGGTINMGVGGGGYHGYSGYIGRTLPVVHFDYEIGITKSLTLAPFINLYNMSKSTYWGSQEDPFRYHAPVGVKGTYYLNKFLHATSKWDFYVGGSLGGSIEMKKVVEGEHEISKTYNNGRPLFFDTHMGAEYHINKALGVFLDLSSGVSTIGIAIR